ncbi:MAG TPA: M67 family metallopeptidase [Solirubrobacteraceae bacterium]|nr:M67 family metallopeptidase [Solirubrobacteraceae bacterium]
MIASQTLLDELIGHARAEYDAECCGLIAYVSAGADEAKAGAEGAVRGVEDANWNRNETVAVAVHKAANVYASRKRFEIDGKELSRAIDEFEDAGWELGAIYHSHTHTEPYPSQTDINFAANWPGLEWVIVGLAGEEPEVRCYLIEDGQVREVGLEVR